MHHPVTQFPTSYRSVAVTLLMSLPLLAWNCSKKKDPGPQLPAATSVGANTFGCLINGQVYTPQGRVGLGANLYVDYDPTYNGGNLIIGTYRVGRPDEKIYLYLSGTDISGVGTYEFDTNKLISASYSDFRPNALCKYYDSQEPSTYSKGSITITRLDLRQGVISGTFNFTLKAPTCDSLKVTQGRFDARM